MACPRYDFHIHTKYLGCAKPEMEVPAILAECERVGVAALAFTDHLNRPDQIGLHAAILADIKAADCPLDVYFGVELNFMSCDGPLALDQAGRARHGFQFAIGGVHETYIESYDLGKMVAIQHRHHLAICANPLVDVLVHPYWFSPHEFEVKGFPVFNSMKAVPPSCVRELGQAAAQTRTAIEINADANFVKHMGGGRFADEYVGYLAALAEEGPMFSVSSDAHNLADLANVKESWDVVERLGLGADRIWKPAGEPVNKRR